MVLPAADAGPEVPVPVVVPGLSRWMGGLERQHQWRDVRGTDAAFRASWTSLTSVLSVTLYSGLWFWFVGSLRFLEQIKETNFSWTSVVLNLEHDVTEQHAGQQGHGNNGGSEG